MVRMLTRTMLALILLSGFVWAQEEDDNNDGGEASHGVARVSLINGDVSVQRGDSGDTVAAVVNGPLVAGDHLLTGPAARAEIQFDWANYLRLGTDTEVRLASLENNQFQIQVGRGTATLAVIRDSDGQVEIDTPNMAFRPHERGVYRISVTDDGVTEVTVRAGQGETYSPQGTQPVQAGQTMMVRGPVDDPEYQIVQAIPVDEWDRWNQGRDRQLLNTRAYQYVSPDIQGAAELDNYGQWVYAAPYGWVWSPSGVGPDWAPYRDGRWSWLDWYGWTWISYDPWGWAPYHYGRWFYRGGFGWCWYPGPVYHHYYWRPALVSFFGAGNIGVGVGFGSIGWVPLGPHEPYHAWYGHGWYGFHGGGTYVNNVRVTNVTNIRNTYVNARVGNGISGVGAGAFGRGGRPGPLHFTGHEQMSMMRGPVPVTPSAASLHMSDRPARFAAATSGNTQFYSPRGHSSPAPRVPFSAQQQGAARYAQQQAGPADRGFQGRPSPTVRGWRTVQPQPGANAVTGQAQTQSWRQYGQAPRADVQRLDTPRNAPNVYQRQASPDWRRFGQAPQNTRPQYTQPRTYQGNAGPRYVAPRGEGVRINPPIVRQRSQPSGSSGRSGGGGGGGGRSSGGGGRSSGGGGHSGGGGGGHSSGGSGGRGR